MAGEEGFSNLAANESRRLLSIIALFEGDFSIDWIVLLSGTKPSQILFALAEGVKQGWLCSKGPGIFCSKNLKKRKQLESQLTREEKEQFHRQIAALLMRELPHNENKAQAMVHHLLQICNDATTCPWLLNAAKILRRANHYEKALQCYAKALKDLSDSHGEELDSLFIEAAIEYSKVSTARHDTAKVLSVIQEAMLRAKRWNKQAYQALLELHSAKNVWLRSQYISAMGHFQKGWSMAQKLNDPKLLRSATVFSTFFLFWQGQFQKAVSNYEESVPEVEKFPQGRFPILAASVVGRCYTHIGQITQGLGMLDALNRYCLESRDHYLSAQVGVTIGSTMLDIGRMDEALRYLHSSGEEANREHNNWIKILGKLLLAYAYHLNGKNERSVAYLQDFLHLARKVKVTVWPYPYLLELCWAMKKGDFPHIPNLSFKKELWRMLKGKNIFLMGVAYKYQALLQRQESLPHERIMETLNLSLRCLEESGHQIELARSQMEIGRQYLLMGDEEKAKKTILIASKILSPFNEALMPDDLRSVIKELPQGKNLLGEILKLGQEVVTIRNKKDLVQSIISTVNRITGAERGAIFLLEGDSFPPRFRLRASKNLTYGQISQPSFSSSMKIIEEVAITGKSKILRMTSANEIDFISNEIIRSCICVPMILNNKILGVLYLDNRLLGSGFRESDLELLAYFAAQAAFAMDNAEAYAEIQRLNQKLTEEKLYYEEQHIQSLHFEEIVGQSPSITRVLRQVEQVAKTETTVLILGETGVGKELVARAIHRHGPRCGKPFIRVFCSALAESLIPSELFGHEKGAFTGAIQRRIGRFELADGGTLFMDEIGDLPLEVQVVLLRVLQSKEFERVGGSETVHSDFRLVVATNRNLEQAVKAGRFRADLYYRLNVFPIYVPPLKERKGDIPLLAHYFLKIYAAKMGKTFASIPKSEMDILIQYEWPGNIRELENIIERGTILRSGPIFRVPELGVGQPVSALPEEDPTLSGNERRHILWALEKTGWKVRGYGGAAELLNVHFSTLTFRMKKLGIQRPPEFLRKNRI